MICVPIVGRTPAQARRQIDAAAALADVLELRMDLMAGEDVEGLVAHVRARRPDMKILVTAGGRDAAACVRKADRRCPRVGDVSGPVGAPADAWGRGETGRNPAAEEDVLARAVAVGADFVDAALGGPEDRHAALLALIAAQGGSTRLIVSHHDFRETPSPRRLRALLAQCRTAGAHIAKIVTTARRPADNLAVLGLIPYARRRGGDIIAFCMGAEGRMSRAVAPLIGSVMSYAALRRGIESAPGQFTVREMRRILKELGHGQ